MSDPYYRTAEWRELRAACLRREPICRTPGCGQRASHADHIVPRTKGGADSLRNLRGLCATCHSRVTRKGNVGALPATGCDAAGTPHDPTHWWNG